jgi:hypothetical protein
MFNLFKKSKIEAELLKQNEELKNMLTDCSQKLVEKQEHINKTNAYWKKKMREMTSSKKS